MNPAKASQDNTTLRSYKMYEKAFESYGDPASRAYSFSILDEFIAREATRKHPFVRCTTLEFSVQEGTTSQPCRAIESKGPGGVKEFVRGLPLKEDLQPSASTYANDDGAIIDSSRPTKASIIIVEDLCPEAAMELGLALRIPPQFWSEYLESRQWYLKQRVASQLAALPSVRNRNGFVKLQWIEPRPFRWTPENGGTEDGTMSAENDLHQFIISDVTTNRTYRIAGVLRPSANESNPKPPIAFIRKTLTVWMSRKHCVDGRLIALRYVKGVILADPPFSAKGVEFLCPSHHNIHQAINEAEDAFIHHFNPSSGSRFRVYVGAETLPPPGSTRVAFASELEEKLSGSLHHRLEVLRNPFSILESLYSRITTEWLFVNEHVECELCALELALEYNSKKLQLQSIKGFLQTLFYVKRRFVKYTALVEELLRQSEEHGPPAWQAASSPDAPPASSSSLSPSSSSSPRHSSPLSQDFRYVMSRFNSTRARIESNITVLLAFVTVAEAEQALADGKGIARLTRVAAVFLPFSTVAAVMAIPQDYLGPGGTGFWIFWLVSVVAMGASLLLASGVPAIKDRATKTKMNISIRKVKIDSVLAAVQGGV